MKSLLSILTITTLLTFSCSKDSPKKIEKELADGNWKVLLFMEDNVDETSDFSGYTFTFNDDNTVVASNGSTNVSGTWKLEKESDDDDSKHTELTFTFPVQNNFDELNDDWHVLSHSDSKIELEDVSGDGSVDKLVFQKN